MIRNQIAVLAVCALVALSACNKKPAEETRGERDGGGKRGGAAAGGPSTVKVAVVERKLMPRSLSVVAVLQGRQQAEVYSKVLGRIAFRGPAEGEPIKQGQLLFRVDRSDPGETFLNVPIVSPLTGWVGLWHVTDVGEQITTQEPVVTVVDDTELKATVFLPANDWLTVNRQTAVTVQVGAEARPGRVTGVARAAAAASGRGSITVITSNTKRDWRSGLSASITFALEPRDRILVPALALTITDQGTFIYIAEGGKAKRVVVTFAVFDSDTVEITSGVEPGSQIIVAGTGLIGDGSPIKVLDNPRS